MSEDFYKHVAESNSLIDEAMQSVESVEELLFSDLNYTYYKYFINISNEVRVWCISNIPPKKNNVKIHFIHEGTIDNKIDENKTPIILVHGYAGSGGFFKAVFDSITCKNRTMYAFDLPGFGRSSRVKYSYDSNLCELQFINLFNEILSALKIDKMLIIAHSLGGYLSTCYILQNHRKVEKIIYIDPWGYRVFNEAVTYGLKNSSLKRIIREIFSLRHLYHIIGLYLLPYSYFSIFRLLGTFLSSNLLYCIKNDLKCKRPSTNCFVDDFVIYKYLMYINSCKINTGEEIIQTLANFVGYSQNNVARRVLNSDISMNQVFIFGEKSFLNTGEVSIIKNMKKNVDIEIIEDSGHFCYIENPNKFCHVLDKYID